MGDDAEDSELDLLIDPGKGLGLMGIARITLVIEEITKVKVDVPSSDDTKTPRAARKWQREFY